MGDPGVRDRIERIGETFVEGYHAALLEDDPERLGEHLDSIELELRGFAYEGAAMGLALPDFLTPWPRNRWRAFRQGPGAAHLYMLHVGVGWALARLPVRLARALTHLDPLLRWLMIDGYGFHQGYFHWPRFIQRRDLPRRLSGYALCAFDQGLGRSLWFVKGADPVRIAAAVAAFPVSRREHQWSGLGLASAYAGGVGAAVLALLREAAGPYLPQLAQGAAFAAKARARAGNPAEHTELACQVLCGLSADAAAALTDEALENLPPDGSVPAYEVWRRRIQQHLSLPPSRRAGFAGPEASHARWWEPREVSSTA